jgi:hypothetical protein
MEKKITGPYSQDFVFFVTYEWAQLASVLAPGSPFQTNLMFVGKARAYPSETFFQVL